MRRAARSGGVCAFLLGLGLAAAFPRLAGAAPATGAASGAPPPANGGRRTLAAARRWICFYGKNLSRAAWDSLDLAILEPDAFAVSASSGLLREGGGPVRLAYVSAGEAGETRAYWKSAAGKPFIVEPDVDWPGAHRVDLRSADWRRIVSGSLVAPALQRGYQGVFLDTLDAAPYLEAKDSRAYAGSIRAAEGLVRSLRAEHPEMYILLNNALPFLDDLGDAIDGVVVEDLYTRCPPKGGACGPTPAPVTRAKEAVLRRFQARTGKPVFVLLYAEVDRWYSGEIRRARRRCRRLGFLPYVTVPSLERLGVVGPGEGRR